jgi:hypothetical protein
MPYSFKNEVQRMLARGQSGRSGGSFGKPSTGAPVLRGRINWGFKPNPVDHLRDMMAAAGARRVPSNRNTRAGTSALS